MGVDSTQALLLAIKVAAAELYDAEPQVFWWDPDDVLDLPILMHISLWALAIAATITVGQRIWTVRRQALARAAAA